jgi:hypothetical protein
MSEDRIWKESLTATAQDVACMKTEEISKLHQIHIEALGYLERVVTTLGTVAGAEAEGSDVKANQQPGFLHRLLHKAKKLKDDIVANAKVLAHQVAQDNKKAKDYLRRSSIGRALHAGSSEHGRAVEEHDKQQQAVDQQRDDAPKAPAQSNIYFTSIA